ncbi:unnamed protein product [Cercospora beticola]|nr:unnamed protein product [Cercospora beticola]
MWPSVPRRPPPPPQPPLSLDERLWIKSDQEKEDTFSDRRWEWYLDHGYTSIVPIHRIYEGDEELTDPRAKNKQEMQAAEPKDVNDVLIQMVRIAEHLKRRGHCVGSWDEIRLRLSDADLSRSRKTLDIKGRLMRKQGEVFWEMSRDGHKSSGSDSDGLGLFLRAGRDPGGWCFLLSDMMWFLPCQSMHNARYEESLSVRINRRRAKINKCRRHRRYDGPLIKAFERKAEEWKTQTQNQVFDGFEFRQLRRDLEAIFEALDCAEEILEDRTTAKEKLETMDPSMIRVFNRWGYGSRRGCCLYDNYERLPVIKSRFVV